MATNADVVSAIQSLIAAVRDKPSNSGGVTVDYIEMAGFTPLYAMNYESDPRDPAGTQAGWNDVVGFTASLPGIVNPRDILVVNGVLTVRNTKGKRENSSVPVSADTVIPITVTCAVGSDGKTVRVSLPRVACKRPEAPGAFISTSVISWTPIATARYSQ